MARKPTYSKKLVQTICEDLATGNHTIADVCKRVGIGETTFYDWQAAKPEFAEAIKKAKEKRLEAFADMARSGLAKLLDTHEYEEVTTEYENDKSGNPVIKSQKRSRKKIMPNPTAVIFTLTNRDAANWKNRQSIEAKGDINHNIGFSDFLMNVATVDEEEKEGGDVQD